MNKKNNPSYPDTNLSKYGIVNISILFWNFLSITRKLSEKLNTSEEKFICLSKDFFDKEEELWTLFSCFLESKIIEEEEYYYYLSIPFENSVYLLLKKLYFDWYFNWEIERVDSIRHTLVDLAEKICLTDIENIQNYYKKKLSHLTDKEEAQFVEFMLEDLLRTILEGSLKKDSYFVWDLIDVMQKRSNWKKYQQLCYATSDMRYVSHKCLLMMLQDWYLDEYPSLQSRVINYLKEYFFLQPPKKTAKHAEREKGAKELKAYLEINYSPFSNSIQKILDAPSEEKINIFIQRYIIRTFPDISLWKYTNHQEKQFKAIARFLYSQKVIPEDQYDVLMQCSASYTAPYDLLHTLVNEWYMDKTPWFKKHFLESFDSHVEVHQEEFAAFDAIDKWEIKQQVSSKDIQNTFDNMCETHILLLETHSIDETSDFLWDTIDFLLEHNIIQAEYLETIASKDVEEYTREIFIYLLVSGNIKSAETIKEVLSYLKTHYIKHNKEKLLELSDFFPDILK